MRTEWRPTRSPRLVVLAIVALAAIGAGLVPAGRISGRQESFPLEIGATLCQRAPDTLAPQALSGAGCEPASGIRIEVRTQNGEPLGECVTAVEPTEVQIATCAMAVPFDTAVLAYEDESTLPPGFAPLNQGLFERTPPRGVGGYPTQFFINVPAAQEQAPPSVAPEGQEAEFLLRLQAFVCAPGVTADQAPAGCAPTGDGFAVTISSLEGIAEPLQLADATRVDGAYIFGDEVIQRRGMFGRLAIDVTALPPGYAESAVSGEAVSYDAALDRYVLRLAPEAPQTDVAIYALNPSAPTSPAEAPAAGEALESWLDDAQTTWNVPGRPIPAAPVPLATENQQCHGQVRPAETAEDAAVVAQGWQLYGAYVRGWGITLVGASLGFDAMCRPVPYQQFVFVDGVFAGTLAPAPTLPQTEGALVDSGISAAERLFGVYLRHAPTDLRCCPSDEATVAFAVERRPEGPVVNPIPDVSAITPSPTTTTNTVSQPRA
jgi:hypothetical protein